MRDTIYALHAGVQDVCLAVIQANARNAEGKVNKKFPRIKDKEYFSLEDRYWMRVDVASKAECWDWYGNKAPNGYGYLGKRIEGKVKNFLAHRLAYEYRFGDIPEGLCVCHHCDNPGCVNPYHLFVGTRSDNMQDCVSKGRHYHHVMFGEDVPNSKLKTDQVLEIRKKYKPFEYTHRMLADEYGVSASLIKQIVNRYLWKHI